MKDAQGQGTGRNGRERAPLAKKPLAPPSPRAPVHRAPAAQRRPRADRHLDPHVPDLRETARRRSGTAGRRPDEEDDIRTARAKGLSERRAVYKHALRGEPTPTVTMLGIDFATIMAGLFRHR
jgi:hypothetical protein